MGSMPSAAGQPLPPSTGTNQELNPPPVSSFHALKGQRAGMAFIWPENRERGLAHANTPAPLRSHLGRGLYGRRRAVDRPRDGLVDRNNKPIGDVYAAGTLALAGKPHLAYDWRYFGSGADQFNAGPATQIC